MDTRIVEKCVLLRVLLVLINCPAVPKMFINITIRTFTRLRSLNRV